MRATIPSAPRLVPALAVLALGLPLSACFTPRVQPQVSQAVLDARAHRDVTPDSCAATPLSAVSPVSAPFNFSETELTDAGRRALDAAIAWLGCHPATPAVIKGAADAHGTAEAQTALSNRRAEVALQYLQAHGVDPSRLRRIEPTAAEPAGEHLLVMAEGQRW